jgi:hypothetical protein
MPQIIQLQGKNPYYYQQRDVTDYGKAEELDFIAAERYRKHKGNLAANKMGAEMAKHEGRPYLYAGNDDDWNPYNAYNMFSASSMEGTPDLSRAGTHEAEVKFHKLGDIGLPDLGDYIPKVVGEDDPPATAGTPPAAETPTTPTTPAGTTPTTPPVVAAATPAVVRDDMPKTISKTRTVLNPYDQPNITAGTQTGGVPGPASTAERVPAENLPEKQTVYQMKMVEEEEKNKTNKMKRNRVPSDRPSYYGGE